MLYVAVAVGLAILIGLHELVVRIARRTIRRPWAVLLGIPAGYVVLAGFALALYAGYGMRSGRHEYVVDVAMPGYDAAGKLEAGDRILEVDGVAPSRMGPTLVSLVEASGGKPVVLTIERAGERRAVTIQPRRTTLADRTQWILGIKNRSAEVRVHDTAAAVTAAALYPFVQTRTIAVETRELILGTEEPDIGGPMRIIEEFQTSMQMTFETALQMFLVFGVYGWLALCVLDLVRLWRLSRPADARSNVR